MTDPERYLDASPSDLGARLLRSAESDGPSDRSWQRALTAAAAATAATGTASVATGTLAIWLKWLGMGLIAGAVTAYGADRWLRSDAHPVAVSAPLPAHVETPAPKREPKAEVAAVVAPPPSARPERTRPSAVADPPSEPTDSLARELELVDAARKRLALGDAIGTFAKLDAYQKEFPRGRFPEEAGLLRAEASILRGDCATARSLRLAFDGDSGKSVLSRRWKALVDRCR